MQARKTLNVIHISGETQRISITPDDSMVFTADQRQPRLAVIDTKTNTVKTWIPLPGLGYGTASTNDGRWLVVAVPTVNKVSVVDLKTLKVVHNIDVPKAPQEVLIGPANEFAYVSCDASRKIAAINTTDWTVAKLIEAGKSADGLAWAAGQ
jgi:DNA-binding beta-propeller fold protein YncE